MSDFITTTVPLDSLHPHPANAGLFPDSTRHESVVVLAEDIEKHGLAQPLQFATVVGDGHSRRVLVDGHRRWLAVRHLRDTRDAGRWGRIEARDLGTMTEEQILGRIIAAYRTARRPTPREEFLVYRATYQLMQREQGRQHGGDRKSENQDSDVRILNASELMAEAAGRAGITLNRAKELSTIFEKGDEDTRQAVASGGMSVSKAYAETKASRPRPEESNVAENPFKDAKEERQSIVDSIMDDEDEPDLSGIDDEEPDLSILDEEPEAAAADEESAPKNSPKTRPIVDAPAEAAAAEEPQSLPSFVDFVTRQVGVLRLDPAEFLAALGERLGVAARPQGAEPDDPTEEVDPHEGQNYWGDDDGYLHVRPPVSAMAKEKGTKLLEVLSAKFADDSTTLDAAALQTLSHYGYIPALDAPAKEVAMLAKSIIRAISGTGELADEMLRAFALAGGYAMLPESLTAPSVPADEVTLEEDELRLDSFDAIADAPAASQAPEVIDWDKMPQDAKTPTGGPVWWRNGGGGWRNLVTLRDFSPGYFGEAVDDDFDLDMIPRRAG